MIKTLKHTAFAGLGCSLLILGGCATNASVGQMVYKYQGPSSPKSKSLIHNIAMGQVTGGHETNPLWTSQISNSGFQKAVVGSLESSKLYPKLQTAGYRLTAKLVQLHQPFLGLDLTVKATVHYQLLNTKTDKVKFNKTIKSKYTATFSDSPVAFIRLKVANEGAARMNIKQLIQDLYRLEI